MSLEHSPNRQAGTDRFLRPREICHLLGVSPATYWRWVKCGRLPVPQKLGPNVRGTRESQLNRFMEALGSDDQQGC